MHSQLMLSFNTHMSASTLNVAGLYVCVTHTHFVGRIHRLCVTSETINYNGGVHIGELRVSVLFLLDAAGLNKGPPTNTNTGRPGLSPTVSFVFLASCKNSNSRCRDYLAENPSVPKVWRFTLYGHRQALLMCVFKFWLASLTKCYLGFLKVHTNILTPLIYSDSS